MRGNVIGFDPDTNTGAISGHDGNRYDFVTADWRASGRPRHGDIVDFQAIGQRAADIYLIEPEYVAPSFGQFYFSASGRISRKQYWLKFALPVVVISLLLEVSIGAAALAGSYALVGVFYIIDILFGLVMLWPSIAVLIKRIHDRNKSGWLVLLPYAPLLLMAVFSGIGAAAGGGNAVMAMIALVFFLGFFGIVIWFFIEFGCLRGTIGANQYGPDPVR